MEKYTRNIKKANGFSRMRDRSLFSDSKPAFYIPKMRDADTSVNQSPTQPNPFSQKFLKWGRGGGTFFKKFLPRKTISNYKPRFT